MQESLLHADDSQRTSLCSHRTSNIMSEQQHHQMRQEKAVTQNIGKRTSEVCVLLRTATTTMLRAPKKSWPPRSRAGFTMSLCTLTALAIARPTLGSPEAASGHRGSPAHTSCKLGTPPLSTPRSVHPRVQLSPLALAVAPTLPQDAPSTPTAQKRQECTSSPCLLYTSDAADE